jgi:Thioredoxin like C-terminal domain
LIVDIVSRTADAFYHYEAQRAYERLSFLYTKGIGYALEMGIARSACSSTVSHPGNAHRLDVDEEGNGTVVHQRLYQLIREPGSITDRIFEIAFLEPGVEGYVFTFG